MINIEPRLEPFAWDEDLENIEMDEDLENYNY